MACLVFCRPDTYTFNVLMHAFKKVKKIDSVCKLFKEMQNQNYSPDVVTRSLMSLPIVQ